MGNLNASLSKENFGNSSSFGCESGNRLALGVKPSANSQPLPKQYMSVDFHLELELALVVLVVLVVLFFLVVLVNRLG